MYMTTTVSSAFKSSTTLYYSTHHLVQVEESVGIRCSNKPISCAKHAIACHFNIELNDLSSLGMGGQDVFMASITAS